MLCSRDPLHPCHILFTIMYVAFLIDSDALVKITKAGLKETFTAHLDLRMAPVVAKEVIEEGKRLGHADAVAVERNLARKRLRLTPAPRASAKASLFSGGEADLVALYESGHYSAVISDDTHFLKRAIEFGIEVLTPSATLVLLVRKRKLSEKTACERLAALKSYVSSEEFTLAHRELGCGGRR
jgi:hypothetical protein